jgi:hypothetical protein
MSTINITKEEKEAIKKYIGSSYLSFNKNLRERKPLNEEQEELYKNLYSVIDKNRILEDIIVYRGIRTTEEEFQKSLGFNPTFTSTSKDKPFASDECCRLIIHLKKGDMAMDISSFDKRENDVLIAPGIFNVLSRYKKDLVRKIPSFDMSEVTMIISYTEQIIPTIFYELSYQNKNIEHTIKNKDDEKDLRFRKNKRRSTRKSLRKNKRRSARKSLRKNKRRSPRKSLRKSKRRSISNTNKPFTLYKSTDKNKKWDVYVPSKTGKLKKVSYGAAGMSDYTKHKDKERRERYRQRHKRDKIYNPYKPGFWSWWHLWGKSSDSNKAFKQSVSFAKKLLKE